MHKNYYIYVKNGSSIIEDYEETTDNLSQMTQHMEEYNQTESLTTGLKICVMPSCIKTPQTGKDFYEQAAICMRVHDDKAKFKALNDLQITLKVLFALDKTLKAAGGLSPDESKNEKIHDAIMIVGGVIATLAQKSREELKEDTVGGFHA